MKNHAYFCVLPIYLYLKSFLLLFLIAKSLIRFLKLILCNTSVFVLSKDKASACLVVWFF